MNETQQLPCSCASCPVSGCLCGCQRPVAPTTCACGPQCPCGPTCTCAKS